VNDCLSIPALLGQVVFDASGQDHSMQEVTGVASQGLAETGSREWCCSN
jgi:hypothetical protein